MSDKKQETKQPTKSESAKPKPYPLRSIDYTENPKDIITIEQPIEDDK
jgi:hypothetical protein